MKKHELMTNNKNDLFDLIDSFFLDDGSRLMDARNAFKIDVKDEDKKYIVEAELPGFNKEDVSASLKDHWLEIAATKNEERTDDSKYLYKERSTTTVKRKVYLDDAVNEKIDAKLEEGILKMEIPKDKDSKAKMIEIK